MARRFYIRWVPSVRTMKWIGRLHTWLYRKTGGLIGSRADGLDMLLLTTRGRRSGEARTTPLPWFVVAGRIVVVASFGGNVRDPDWVHNVRSEPQVTLQIRRDLRSGRLLELAGEDRAEAWQAISAEHPRYREYQSRTSREIPLLGFEPGRPEEAREAGLASA